MIFLVAPDVLYRVEFRSGGEQALNGESFALLADERADPARAMCRQPVPHRQELAAELAQQMVEKVDNLSGAVISVSSARGPTAQPKFVADDLAKGKSMPRFDKILCPVDFDQNSVRALRVATELAQERKGDAVPTARSRRAAGAGGSAAVWANGGRGASETREACATLDRRQDPLRGGRDNG
jgi:hypothetical protein